MTPILKPMLLATLMTTGSLTLWAQAAPPMTPGATDQRSEMRAQMPARMKDTMRKRAADLKAALKLSADQEDAWSSFVDAMKSSEHIPRPDRAEMDKLTTPQRLDKIREMRKLRDAEMDRRMDATKTFYATLTSEQKSIFDAHTARRHPYYDRQTMR